MRATSKIIWLGALFAGLGLPASSQADDDTSIALATGTYFTSGTYGGERNIEDLYVPLTFSADFSRVGVRLTVPYLTMRAPEGTVSTGPGGEPIPGTGPMTTTSGLGDVLASVTFYDAIYSRDLGIALDLTGKIKFGTADEQDGLGTGEIDYTVQADLLKFLDQTTLIATAGYTFRGDPAEVDLNDVFSASLGGIYRFTDQLRGGLFFDYREASLDGLDDAQELTAVVMRRFDNGWRLQAHVLAGFSDNSPDWGGGIQVKRVM